MKNLHILFCMTLTPILRIGHLGYGHENLTHSTEIKDESTGKNDLGFLKKLYHERRKKHHNAVKKIKNVESYEKRYKMISIITEEIINIIESKKSVIERVHEGLKKNSTTSLSNGNIADALLAVCENTVLFSDILLQNPDITHRILKKNKSWYETLKWSLTFVNENQILLDESSLSTLRLAVQELNLVQRVPGYTNPNWTKSPSNPNNSNEKQKKSRKAKRKSGPQLVHVDL